MNDCSGLSERKDEAHANLGGFFRWPSDRRIKWANDQKFADLKFLLPIGWQEEWIETARGTSDNSLWPAQKNSEAFLFDRRVKAADHGAIFSAPEVSGIDCFNDLVAGTCSRTEHRVQRFVQELGVSM